MDLTYLDVGIWRPSQVEGRQLSALYGCHVQGLGIEIVLQLKTYNFEWSGNSDIP